MSGFIGYKGGVSSLLSEAGVPTSAFLTRATKTFNVLHIGSHNRHKQYKYTQFVHPIVQRAVDGGATQLVYLLTEGSQKITQKTACSALVGDYADVCRYVEHLSVSKNMYGVYYYQYNPTKTVPQKVKAFLDFDLIRKKGEPWESVWEHVLTAIEILNAAFTANISIQQADEEFDIGLDDSVVISYGVRPVDDLHDKHSFHVTWKHQGFFSQQDQSNFMQAQLGSADIEYDPKVYSNGRLLRGPWFGKGGDKNAILLPVIFNQADDGSWSKTFVEEFDETIFRDGNIAVYDWDDNITFHRCSKMKLNERVCNIGVRVAQTTEESPPTTSFAHFRFFEPLLTSVVIPRIQAHRRELLQYVQKRRLGLQSGVPVSQYKTTEWEASPRFPGQFLIRVIGDTFCEYDTCGDTPYYHQREKIKICVDLQHGSYHQLCYTCKCTPVKYSIFAVNDIQIGEFTASSPRVLDIIKNKGASLFLRYVQSDILFNPLHNNKEFVVYDEKTKLWCAENSSYMILAMAHAFQQKYRDYRVAVYDANFLFRLGQCGGNEKKMEKLKKERVALQCLDVFPASPEATLKEFKAIYKNLFGSFSVMDLNICDNLVPLRDGTCYDVFTDTIVPRTKEMYFTSMLSDVVKPTNRDDECREIKAWFLEIARGREELAVYLMTLFGLVMTSLDIDRHFYVLVGVLGRNGKSVVFEKLEVNTFFL